MNKQTNSKAKRFNFTYAIDGGAWIEWANGDVRWEPRSVIEREMGKGWFERMFAKQGMFTGCWINCAE
jgi:hypothetical protein